MSYDKNSIRYRIFVVILAATVFASIVVFSRPIVLAEEAVVLEPQETESLTAEQNLNQSDEALAIGQSSIQNDEALQIDSIEEVSSSDIPDSVLESVDTVDLNEETSENSDTGKNFSLISLSIDMDHVYEGMELSYKDGYVPSITENTVSLIIPFVADTSVENNQLTVTLETTSDSPFEKAEYEEEVSLQTYQFESDGISESVDAYLFQVEFTLADDYQAGQYPVTIKAIAYSASGVKSEMICRMTVTLESDSRQQTESETEPASEIETEIGQTSESESESEPETDNETESENTAKTETETESETETTSDSSYNDASSSTTYYSSGGSYSSGSGSNAVKHQPHILLKESSLSGAQLPAGEQMDFTASFQNTSDDQTVYSLKITVNTADENVALSSTSYYYDRVAPQEVIILENTIAASAAATQKMTALSYAFVYETLDGTALSDSEELFFDISQETQVSIENFNLSDYVYSLETVTATLEIRNTGRGPVYNVQVSLEADGLIATNTVYAGNMEAGSSSDGTLRIYVSDLKDKDESSQDAEDSDTDNAESAYGTTIGQLTLTWEDAYGTVYTETREFTTTIAAPQVVELSVEAEEESVTNQWWAVTIVIMVLFFLLLIAVLIRKLTKKRHQMEDLLAEMEHSYDKTETK